MNAHASHDDDRDPAALAARWIDGEETPTLRAQCEQLDDEGRRKLADHLLIHSLIERLGENRLSSEHNVDAALDAISEFDAPAIAVNGKSTTVSRRSWLVSGLSIAAGLMGVTVIWLATEATAPSAHAAVAEAIRQADLPLDRHYRISAEFTALGPMSAELYLQGSNKVALHLAGPLNLGLWMGSDSQRCWIVPPAGPVVSAKDFDNLKEWQGDAANLPIPLLKISELLRVVERDYDLMSQEHDPKAREEAAWRHIRATKRPGFRPLLPQQVDIWVEPETGIIRRLLLDWTGQVENLAIRRMECQFIEQRPRPANWYHHSAHHETDRPLLEL